MASESANAHVGGEAGKITLTVVTPTGPAASATATTEVVAPGILGEFGVLPGHVPLLAALKPGVLAWKDPDGRHVLAVDKGYLQVGAENRVIVLVEAAQAPAKIDVAKAQAERDAESAKLKEGNLEPVEQQATRDRLAWAQARIDATSGPATAKAEH